MLYGCGPGREGSEHGLSGPSGGRERSRQCRVWIRRPCHITVGSHVDITTIYGQMLPNHTDAGASARIIKAAMPRRKAFLVTSSDR